MCRFHSAASEIVMFEIGSSVSMFFFEFEIGGGFTVTTTGLCSLAELLPIAGWRIAL